MTSVTSSKPSFMPRAGRPTKLLRAFCSSGEDPRAPFAFAAGAAARAAAATVCSAVVACLPHGCFLVMEPFLGPKFTLGFAGEEAARAARPFLGGSMAPVSHEQTSCCGRV